MKLILFSFIVLIYEWNERKFWIDSSNVGVESLGMQTWIWSSSMLSGDGQGTWGRGWGECIIHEAERRRVIGQWYSVSVKGGQKNAFCNYICLVFWQTAESLISIVTTILIKLYYFLGFAQQNKSLIQNNNKYIQRKLFSFIFLFLPKGRGRVHGFKEQSKLWRNDWGVY